MKITLISILFLININLFQEINPEALKKDPTFLTYKKVANELKDGMRTGKYVMPTDFARFGASLGADATPEKMKQKLKEMGMKNGDEFIDKLNKQNFLMAEFLKKYPAIGKMDVIKRKEFLTKLLNDL